MRILFINWRDIFHPEAGGAEMYLHEMGKVLIKAGHDVTLFSSNYKNAKKYDEIDGIKIIRNGGKFSIYWKVMQYYLKHKDDFDIIIESINTVPFLVPVYAKQPVVALIYSVNNKRALIRELGVTPISLVLYLINLLLPVIYKTKSIITISNSGLKELSELGFDPKKIFVVYPCVSSEFDRLVDLTPNFQRPNYNIVYLGRLKKYKGIEIILDAVSLLIKKLPIKFVVIGKGSYEPDLKKKVQQLGIKQNVSFLGYIDEKEKVQILKNSSVFVCCSIDEGGWTLAGLEALKCGVPLVVTNSQKDLVIDGKNGFICDYSAMEVANRIKLILFNEWSIKSSAAINYSSKFTWENSTKELIKALHYSLSNN